MNGAALDAALTATRDAALGYASRGVLVIPLHGIVPDWQTEQQLTCTCNDAVCGSIDPDTGKHRGSPGKHPRTPHGLKDATTDADTIRGYWSRWPTSNVGIVTGPESGLLVVDVDGAAGYESIKRLQHEYGSLSDTLWARTGSGGWHCFLRYPEGSELGNSAKMLGDGLDTRGAGGYVVAPPSLHVTGGFYRFHGGRKPAECPSWLVRLLTPPPITPPRPMDTTYGNGSEALDRAVDGIVRQVALAPAGTRNDLLWWGARKLGAHYAVGNVSLDRVYALLLAAADANGVLADDGERACRNTIRSGVDRGQRDSVDAA